MSKLKFSNSALPVALVWSFLALPVAHAQEAAVHVGSDGDVDADGRGDVGAGLSSRVRAGAFLGGNYLSSENELGNSFHNDQVPGSGFLLGLRASYLLLDSILPDSTIRPQLNAEVEGKFTFSSTEGGSGRASIDTPVAGWRVSALLDLYPDNKLVPFALVGIGGETVFGSNKFMTSPDTDFASYLGAGLRYGLADQVDLRADLRVGMTASRVDTVSALSELHLGISYTFGKDEPTAAPVDITVEDHTERVADRDRDGVPDATDACPELAEIQNGIDDEDGCPEVDSDNDGLLGSRDQCPAAAEDVDGFMDDDGCPDPDNDGDGRPDVIDQCPGEAENLNGYEDEDGCPDVIPEQVQAFTGTIEGIQFKFGSARILRKSRVILDKAFEVLNEHKSVRIEISGHTDDQGNIEANRTLSRKRADYVKWYLVDKGIDATRISTVGMGPDAPIGDNATDVGRQMNRRIEFRLLPGAASVGAPGSKTPEPAPQAPAPGSETPTP